MLLPLFVLQFPLLLWSSEKRVDFLEIGSLCSLTKISGNPEARAELIIRQTLWFLWKELEDGVLEAGTARLDLL